VPLVNVIRGERIDSTPLNVRTPVVRIPLWMAVAWWLLKGLSRLTVVAIRLWRRSTSVL
jgi:S-DNA-T family DNA segregation ATPase FtsK/SpoIIIE